MNIDTAIRKMDWSIGGEGQVGLQPMDYIEIAG